MRQIIIVIITFILILWFQSIEDYKYKKIRHTIYDKYKYPLFISSIVALILSSYEYLNITESITNNNNNITEIIPIQKIKNFKSNILDQQIYIDPSPF